MTRDHFIHMASYNIWANELLFSAVAELSDEQLHADIKGFFKSAFGALNHILLADHIWMSRLTNDGFQASGLDMMLAEDFDDLRHKRAAMDQRILAFTSGLGDTQISRAFSYHDMAGTPHSLPMTLVLTHLFNHQTHHRGQVHHMLSTFGHQPPQLDLIYFAIEHLEGEHD